MHPKPRPQTRRGVTGLLTESPSYPHRYLELPWTMTRVCSSSACPSIHDLGHSACCTGSGSVRTILLLESSGPPTDPFLLPHLPTGLKGLSKFPRAHVFVAVDLDLCALLALFLHFSNAYTRTSPSMVLPKHGGKERSRQSQALLRSGRISLDASRGKHDKWAKWTVSSGRGMAPVGITRATGATTAGGHSCARSARCAVYVHMYIRVYTYIYIYTHR